MRFPKTQVLLIIVTTLVGGFFISSTLQSVSAQAAPLTPTPNPTIAALENRVSTQQVQIRDLSQKLEDETRDRKYYDRDIQWKWGILAAVGGAVAWILTWVGRNSLNALQQDWEKHSQGILDRAIYKLDLSNLSILLPISEGMEGIHQLLIRRKFNKAGFYGRLDEFKNGILVVSLKGKNQDEQKQILSNFKEYVTESKFSVSNAGFIIYCPGEINIPADIMNCHDNLVTAKYPSTVISSIFTVGRGIEIAPPEGGQSK